VNNLSASPDGLRGWEGTFSLCSFRYVDTLASAGRLENAHYAFEKMLTYAMSGSIPRSSIAAAPQFGNFPKAFSHLALTHAAMTLTPASMPAWIKHRVGFGLSAGASV
jgi:GH15 family glucan-1,4-alpha-glucosidase